MNIVSLLLLLAHIALVGLSLKLYTEFIKEKKYRK